MKNIRVLFILISLSVFFFSCTNKVKPSKTIISGNIKTDGTPITIRNINLQFPDFINSTTEFIVPVDSLGHFRIELNLIHPTDFSIKFRRRLMYFISPGDSIYLDINQNILQAGNQKLADIYSFIGLTGTAQKVNSDVTHFNSYLIDSLIDWTVEENSIANLDPEQYKTFTSTKASTQEAFLKEFNIKEQTCSEFQEWAKYHICFGIWENIFQYVWQHPEYIKTDKLKFYENLPKSFFDFLQEWDTKNRRTEISSNFFNFMQGFHKKISLDCSSGLDNSDNDFLNLYFIRFKEKVNQLKSQYVKDILFARFYGDLLKSKNLQFLSSIYQPDLIQDKILKSRIQKMYNDEQSNVEKSGLSSESKLKIIDSKNITGFLDTLISPYLGKVIFIDFWGPWCAPCIKELPFSNVLHAELKGRDIVFMYLAVRTNENAWEQAIKQKSIEGDHYLINKEQEVYLLEKFGFNEFPHYALIGKDGLIYKKSTSPPSQKEELMKDINHLLTKK